MLDLSFVTDLKEYQLKWIDGDVITIPAPSMKLYQSMLKITKDDFDEMAALEVLQQILYEVLSTNEEQKAISHEDINKLPLPAQMAVFKDYFDYYTQEMNKVSFQ